ncbi:sugar-binding transcriptional regulator [Lentilactobacillus farraginis]|uniref:Transcriptional regulator, DeoR family n=2 Tax=Lentilactobacillus farraginis TaxID=390841 RepID=A0A0R1VRH8_9LACO|nr:sugar-binding domain-containing protein [Lentilactobacillus farraginis]KRM05206.1 transcriptional regulator, DeoR family [Lentilactobacillus farraginis DSM 18382 = JCM 14108]
MHAEKKNGYSYEKFQQIIEISRYYYQDGLSQIEIAKKMGLSRPTISKALQTARESGIVTIKITDPFENTELIEKQLKKKYGLKDVLIASQVNRNEKSIIDSLGEKAADYLNKIVHDDDIIGINWGRTMEAVANHLRESQCQNVKVVQLKGSVTNSKESNYSADITNKFNHAFHTQANILPLPVIFGDSKIKSIVVQDQFIENVIREGYEANVALFTVGTTRPKAMLFRLGYLGSVWKLFKPNQN